VRGAAGTATGVCITSERATFGLNSNAEVSFLCSTNFFFSQKCYKNVSRNIAQPGKQRLFEKSDLCKNIERHGTSFAWLEPRQLEAIFTIGWSESSLPLEFEQRICAAPFGCICVLTGGVFEHRFGHSLPCSGMMR